MSQEGSQVPFHFAVTDLEAEKSYVGENSEGFFERGKAPGKTVTLLGWLLGIGGRREA